MDAPGDASSSLIGSVHAVSAVVYSACWCDLPMAGTGPNRVRELESSDPRAGFPDHLTVPYLSSDLLASPTASRASPSQAMPGAR